MLESREGLGGDDDTTARVSFHYNIEVLSRNKIRIEALQQLAQTLVFEEAPR